MRRLLAAALFACLALPQAAPAIDFGAADDLAKMEPGVYSSFADVGFTTNVVSLTWDPDNPTALPPDTAQIDRLVAAAPKHGVEVIFALYQKRAAGLSGPVDLAAFSSFIRKASQRWPSAKRWIGPNEPNQPRFWQPQFNPDCSHASAKAYAGVMGAMYDAVKTVDPADEVVGVALSPRGNDDCRAASNVSTSPVMFLYHLGKAFRSGRGAGATCRPLMDSLSFHPYPNVNTDSPMKGYTWPNAGVPNLDRLKQAFSDAFAGTCQTTFEQGLALHVDELGWQVDTNGRPGYYGAENVAPVDEATQARYYAEAIKYLPCDPAVRTLNFFLFRNQADRDRFQSGLQHVDGTRMASYAAVKAAIGETRGRCLGGMRQWRPETGVVGAKVDFGKLGRSSSKRTYWSFHATAQEDATYSAAIFRVGGPVGAARRADLARSLSASRPFAAAATMAGRITANYNVLVKAPSRRLKRGLYVYAIRVSAFTNPKRSELFVSAPFRVVNQ